MHPVRPFLTLSPGLDGLLDKIDEDCRMHFHSNNLLDTSPYPCTVRNSFLCTRKTYKTEGFCELIVSGCLLFYSLQVNVKAHRCEIFQAIRYYCHRIETIIQIVFMSLNWQQGMNLKNLSKKGNYHLVTWMRSRYHPAAALLEWISISI